MRKQLQLLALIGSFMMGSLSITAQTYCTGGPSSAADSEIINVALTGDNYSISNLLTCPGATGVQNFTTTDSADVSQGTSYTLNITFGTCGGVYGGAGRAWIDYNDDGDFDDAGEDLGFWSGTPAGQGTTTYNAQFGFTVPTTATLGQTRMRVMQRESGTTTTTTPCATFTWGTIEDYTINITNTPPPCPNPGSGAFSMITATSAMFSWASTGTAFEVQWDTTGFSLGSGDSTTTSATNYTMMGLTANTDYDVYVRNNCTGSSNGKSIWVGPYSFTTACAAFSIPFDEDFEGIPSGSTTNPAMPNCWTYAETQHGGAGYAYVYNSTTYANSGSQAIYCYTSTNYTYGDTQVVISPEIEDMDSIYVQMEFYARARYVGTSYDEVLYIGTIADPSDLSTITVMDTISLAGIDTYTYFASQFDPALGYNGTDKHIVIWMDANTTYDYIHIDDIKVEAIPACPRPLYPTFSGVTNNTANLSFSSSGSKFLIEYGPCGFNQGTGTYDTLYTSSGVLTGLTANTEYEVYIQSDCSGSGDGVSSWTQSDCFRTACDAFPTPFSENFDGTPSGSSSNPSQPLCWDNITTTHGGYGYGYTRNYATYANSGSQFWYMYHSNTTDSMALVTPEVSGMDVTDKHIQFWARSTSASRSEHLIIGTLSDSKNMSTFSAVDTVAINSTTYQFFDVYLTAANGYNGTDTHIAMMLWTGTSYTYGYACIDDITVADVPSCVPSTGLMASGVTNSMAILDWTPGDGAKFDLEYGPTGFTQGTGAPMVMGLTDSTYTLTGLTGNTCYDVYVRDSCSTVNSPWFGPITFCTACDPQATPLLEDFESLTSGGNTLDPNLPDCWGYWRNPATSYYGYTYAYSNPNGSYHWRNYQYYTNDTVALISPIISGITAGTKQVRFKAMSYSTSSGTDVIVGTSPSAASLRNATIIDTIRTDIGNTYGSKEYIVRLDTASGYNGTDQFIFFMQGSYYYYMYLDDINIEDIPLCGAPWSLASGNITSSSADVTWNTIYGTGFQIEYGPTGFIPGTGNGTRINNTVSGATISGLSPNTYYDVYVSDNCDTLDQAGPITFKTDCLSQLTGTYTVGGATSDFATLDSAFAVLLGCGVSGPVTLNLQGGTHVVGPQNFMALNGVNSTNTVTINGMGVGVDTIAATGNIAFTFDDAQYITFQNVSISAPAADRVLWFTNGSHHITFDNCDILGNTVTTSGVSAAVSSSGSTTSLTQTGDNAHFITISNCKIVGGYYGVSFYGGGTTSYNNNIAVNHCTFVDQYGYSIRTYYINGVELIGNMINNNSYRATFGYGLYVYYTANQTIKQNQVYALSYGLYMYNPNNPSFQSGHGIVENNFLASNTTYGAYIYAPNDMKVYHNSTRSGTSYGMYISGTADSTDIRNNIFTSGSNYAMYIATTPTNFTLDYNIYFTGGSSLAYQGSAYSDLSAWQTGQSSYNVNSDEGDPGYLAVDDFHIVGTLPNDVGVNGLSMEDVDGDVRPASGSTTVDIGADEYTPLNWDIALTDIMVSLAGCGDSNLAVQAVVTNYGLSTVTSLPITVNVSGGITQMLGVTSTNSILQGETDTILVGTINTYAGAAGVMFDGYASLTGDQDGSNDTISNVGPGNYIPVVPQHYAPDTVCSTLDSATFAAWNIPGVDYGWFANMADTVPVVENDTLTFAVNGQKTWYLGYVGSGVNTLTIGYAGGNGCSGGNMFNITATKTLKITGFNVNTNDASGTASALSVYYIANGTYVGNETNASAWTLHNTSSATSAGSGLPTMHTFTTGNDLIIPAGSTYAIYCNFNAAYTNGNGSNQLVSNADMTVNLGVGLCSLFGGVNNPRVFNGDIVYGGEACSTIKVPLTLGINNDTAVAAFTSNVLANGADVDFDASTSMGQVFDWNYGDGSIGIGQMTTHTYASAGSYNVCLTVTDTVCNTYDTICKTVLATVGIEESLMNQTLSVFPNPNNGEFRVEFQVEGLKNVTVRVMTLLGQEIYENKLGNISGEYRQQIDLTGHATGVYILQIVTDNDAVSRRITIRK